MNSKRTLKISLLLYLYILIVLFTVATFFPSESKAENANILVTTAPVEVFFAVILAAIYLNGKRTLYFILFKWTSKDFAILSKIAVKVLLILLIFIAEIWVISSTVGSINGLIYATTLGVGSLVYCYILLEGVEKRDIKSTLIEVILSNVALYIIFIGSIALLV